MYAYTNICRYASKKCDLAIVATDLKEKKFKKYSGSIRVWVKNNPRKDPTRNEDGGLGSSSMDLQVSES
jgi:hypothetical protein